jgi:hypothetical protein
MTMAKPTTELGQLRPPPPYTRWDQRVRPVLLSYVPIIGGKHLCLSLKTQDPDIARRHIRRLVAMLLHRGLLSPDDGVAKGYRSRGTGRSQIEKLDAAVHRLTPLSEAEYGPEALAAAKRFGCPVGFINYFTGRKPQSSAGTHATRRLRARDRGEKIAKAVSWHYRRVGGKCFYLNGGMMNARLEIGGRKHTWPLPTRNRDEAAAIMEPVRVAREHVREAARGVLNYEIGSVDYADAVRTREKACIAMAAAVLKAGGPKELADFVMKGPQEEVGAPVPRRAAAVTAAPSVTLHVTRSRKAAERQCEELLIERHRDNPKERPRKNDLRLDMTSQIDELTDVGFNRAYKKAGKITCWDWHLPGRRFGT